VVTACFGLIGINRFDTEWRRPGIYSRIGQSQRERRTLSRVAIREGVEPRTAPGQQPSPEGASQPHRVPIELTFTRRGGRHLTRPRARYQKGSETLEVSSSSPVYRKADSRIRSTTVTAWALRHYADPKAAHHQRDQTPNFTRKSGVWAQTAGCSATPPVRFGTFRRGQRGDRHVGLPHRRHPLPGFLTLSAA
jgi:hypothetical protein